MQNRLKPFSKNMNRNMMLYTAILGFVGLPTLLSGANSANNSNNLSDTEIQIEEDINNLRNFLSCHNDELKTDDKSEIEVELKPKTDDDLEIKAKLEFGHKALDFAEKNKLSLFKTFAQDFLKSRNIIHVILLNHLENVLDNKETLQKEQRQELLKSLNTKSLLKGLDKELLKSAIVDLNKESLSVVREDFNESLYMVSYFRENTDKILKEFKETLLDNSLKAVIKLIEDKAIKCLRILHFDKEV